MNQPIDFAQLVSASGPDFAAVKVMGVLNVTPDSFFDGGRYTMADVAVGRALAMLDEGAHIIDIGGESTRPGAPEVSVNEELDRVIPVIEALRRESGAPVSVDTSKAEVIRAAAAAGASLINDVRALQSPDAMSAAAQSGLPVCLMHMQGEPAGMQDNPRYADVVDDVLAFLLARAEICIQAGIPRDRIILDPGFGFGKSLRHNLLLLSNLDRFVATGYPVLTGLSRKSLIGAILDDAERDRLTGSVTLALYAARKGVHIVRSHDVRETVDALRIESAIAGIDRSGASLKDGSGGQMQ